jgi:hypothetical protein
MGRYSCRLHPLQYAPILPIVRAHCHRMPQSLTIVWHIVVLFILLCILRPCSGQTGGECWCRGHRLFWGARLFNSGERYATPSSVCVWFRYLDIANKLWQTELFCWCMAKPRGVVKLSRPQ